MNGGSLENLKENMLVKMNGEDEDDEEEVE